MSGSLFLFGILNKNSKTVFGHEELKSRKSQPL